MQNSVIDVLSRRRQYKYPYFFLALYITLLLSTTCLASKLTLINTMLVPGGIFVFPLTFSICDIVGEVYGYAYPRLFIWIGILAEFVFSIIVITVSHLPVPAFFMHADAYQIVFDPTLRYVGAGLLGLLVGEFANTYLLVKWKIFLRGKFFIFRSLLSTAFGQACLTIIVDICNYHGKLSDTGLGWMMIYGYCWKMLCALIMVFPAWLLVRYLKKVEKVDHYDINTNFNPFIFSLNDSDSEELDPEGHRVNTGSLPQ